MSETRCKGKITAREIAAWIQSLPAEYQDAEFTAVFGSFPITLKRVVALTSKDGTLTSVCANPVGTHLPFDESFIWHHTITSA